MSLTQSQFQSKCGKLLNHEITATGIFPRRTFIVEFFYESGKSSYDGRDWQFEIYPINQEEFV